MNTSQAFAIGEAFKFGWGKFKNNYTVLVGATVVVWLCQLLPRFVDSSMSGLLSLVLLVLQFFVFLGLIRIALKVHDNQPVEISELWSMKENMGSQIGTIFLQGAIMVVSAIAFFLPLLYFGPKYSLASFLAVDRGLKPMDALKKSGELTKGYILPLLGFYLLIGLLNGIASSVLYGILYLATFPITLIASVYVYRRLLGRADSSSMPVKPPVSAPVVNA